MRLRPELGVGHRASAADLRGPVNLGNPHELSMLTIAQLVKKLTGSGSPLQYEPLPVNDPTQRCPDISKAKKFLDWEPKVDLETGLKRTIDYFRRFV